METSVAYVEAAQMMHGYVAMRRVARAPSLLQHRSPFVSSHRCCKHGCAP